MTAHSSLSRLTVPLLAFFAGVAFPGTARAQLPPRASKTLPEMVKGLGVKGRDNAISFKFAIPGSPSVNVFAFGDTSLDAPNADGQTWVVNTMHVTYDTNMNDGLFYNVFGFDYPAYNERARQWIPLKTPEDIPQGGPTLTGLWPHSQLYDAANGKQYVVFTKVTENGTPDWVFNGIGMASVSYSSSTGLTAQRIDHRPGTSDRWLLFPSSQIGDDPMTVTDGGWVYMYFVDGKTGHARVGFSSTALGAVTVPDFLQPSTWWFYQGGDTWGPNCATTPASVRVTEAEIGSIDYNGYLGAWVYTHCRWATNDIVMRTASSPAGPWSAPVKVASGETGANGMPSYMCRAHKAYEEQNGRIMYVSYSKPMHNLVQKIGIKKICFDHSTCP
jgi:hypothetical protein